MDDLSYGQSFHHPHPNTLRNQWNNNVLPRKGPYDGDDDVGDGDDATEIQDVISIPEMCVKQIPL